MGLKLCQEDLFQATCDRRDNKKQQIIQWLIIQCRYHWPELQTQVRYYWSTLPIHHPLAIREIEMVCHHLNQAEAQKISHTPPFSSSSSLPPPHLNHSPLSPLSPLFPLPLSPLISMIVRSTPSPTFSIPLLKQLVLLSTTELSRFSFISHPNRVVYQIKCQTGNMNHSNCSFYTSKTALRSYSTASCWPYRNSLEIFYFLTDTEGISLNCTYPILICIFHKMYACINVNKYLHFNIRGERKILKQMGQVKSDQSVLPLLMNKENLSQHPFCLESIKPMVLSFSFPIQVEVKSGVGIMILILILIQKFVIAKNTYKKSSNLKSYTLEEQKQTSQNLGKGLNVRLISVKILTYCFLQLFFCYFNFQNRQI